MSPDKKEELLAGVMLILVMALSIILIAALSGCAHNEMRYTSESNPSISHAAEISDKIDGKTIVITEWLKTH